MDRTPKHPRLGLACLAALVGTALSLAQTATRPDAATLAKYDKNNNGVLDAEELAAMQADQAIAARVPVQAPSRDAAPGGDAILMSPFEVSSEAARGYYASSTMSGTRINSRIEDLASSISIVTKEMMSDFAMLDINDIFNYEASTEGLGNFTDIEVNALGEVIDNAQLSPNTANRVRGISSANVSMGNFETSRRVPVDPSNIDSVEISRGPNSNIFGLGQGGGTVNLVTASGNLHRNRSQVQFRADSWGGYRTSLDVNRVLKPKVLAVRGSAVYQHEEWVRKPSGADTVRLNGMFKAQPFKATSITGFYSFYRMNGTRTNYTLPRDGVTFWKESGSPTWDPVTESYRLNGVLTRFPGGSAGRLTPVFFTNHSFIRGATGAGTALMGIDRDGSITHWTPSLPTSTNTPETQDLVQFHYVETGVSDIRTVQGTQPLFATPPSMTGRDLYDWTSINLAAINRSQNTTHTYKAEIDHFFINTPRNLLAAQLGWFREDSKIRERAFYGMPNGLTIGGTVRVDVNERFIDGTPNPNFLRPFIGLNQPLTYESPLLNDTYRGQLAYQLDLTGEKNLLRWLGLHRTVGYKEYKDFTTRRFSFTEAIVSNHPWLAAGASRNASNSVARPYMQYYVGDAVGQNVDYAPGRLQPGTYPFTWGSPITGNWRHESADLGLVATTRSTGGNANVHRILKTEGLNVQSHFLGSRIVTTLGWREDRSYTKRGVTPRLTGLDHNYEWNNQWQDGDWLFREGRTKTAGIVVRPLRWLSLHANKSDNFLPASPVQDIYLNELPNPFNQGRDVGFSLNLFDGKLRIRATQHKTEQLRSRAAATLATRVRNLDILDIGNPSARPFGLSLRARDWIRNANPLFTEEQIDAEVARTIGLSIEHLRGLEDTTLPLGDYNDVTARGREIEIAYNPTSYWTVKFNATEQRSIHTALSASLARWVEERMPYWQSIIDLDTGLPWFTSRYNPSSSVTAQSYLAGNFTTQFKVGQALLGKSRPQVRKYRWNLSTNYRLSGVTDHRIFKRFNVGGALRWEDKGAIGYYGLQQLPDVITDLDPNRPVWAKANFRADAFIGYRTRLFADRVGATFQLNVRNLQENGKLQAISSYPDGSPNGFRIIDPRQFILSVTFDL